VSLERDLVIALISRGGTEENRIQADEHGLTNVGLQEDWEVSEAYRVDGTPSAVLVSPDGEIGGALAAGSEAINGLVLQVAEKPLQLPDREE
jgi:hypothetical protein